MLVLWKTSFKFLKMAQGVEKNNFILPTKLLKKGDLSIVKSWSCGMSKLVCELLQWTTKGKLSGVRKIASMEWGVRLIYSSVESNFSCRLKKFMGVLRSLSKSQSLKILWEFSCSGGKSLIVACMAFVESADLAEPFTKC